MIPAQDEVNWNDPEQHFLWALRNMPTLAGTGAVTHPGFLKQWSKHLWDCAFFHRDYLESLADSDGNIHVSKLRKQTIKLQKAFRGPSHVYNNAARWVKEGTPDPDPMQLPDITKLTIQEQGVMAKQLQDAGWFQDRTPKRDSAEELNEG